MIILYTIFLWASITTYLHYHSVRTDDIFRKWLDVTTLYVVAIGCACNANFYEYQ